MPMAGEQLRVSEGKERGTLLSVDVDLLIGRHAPEDEGRLGGDPEISRRHARVSRGADKQLAIEDLGSANGTYVNGERIRERRMLKPGDSVRVGSTTMDLITGGEPHAAAAAPRPPAPAVPPVTPAAPPAAAAVPPAAAAVPPAA